MDNIVEEPADVNETPAPVAPSDAADEPLAEVTVDSEPAGSAAVEGDNLFAKYPAGGRCPISTPTISGK